MPVWNPNATILQPTALCVGSYGTTTVPVGHARIAGYSETGADLNTEITAVTDITDPANTGGWTELVSITGGPVNLVFEDTTQDELARVFVDENEDDTDALRLQILIDGEVVFDAYSLGDNNSYAFWRPLGWQADAGYSPEIYCETSFMIRAARKGTFADSGSRITYGSISYEYVQKI